MKKQFIKDLKAGDRVREFFVAKHKQLEYFRDKSKGRFLTIVLGDRSGRILGRAWENAPVLYDKFEDDDIIAVSGRVEEYMGRLQIIVERLRPPQAEEKNTRYSDDDFVPQTERDIDVMWAAVSSAADEISNPSLKTLLQTILHDETLAPGLRAAPASKAMHHSYRGGLLEHIVDMLILARSLLTLYPQIDQDLLMTGVILHDLGLVEGALYERDIDYSDAGRLVGHVVLGERIVADRVAAIPGFEHDLSLRLSHIILSHHGDPEHGAVREPQTLEATALALLNRLSAEVNHVQQVLDGQGDPTQPWTDYDRVMRRSFFRGRAPQSEVEEPAVADHADKDRPAEDPMVREPTAGYSGSDAGGEQIAPLA